MIFLRKTYKILVTTLVAASTTWAPPDECRQQGGMTQKVLRVVTYPLLQLCLRLIIAYPKKNIKSPSSTMAYVAIYSQNDKNETL
jgi:hypothetical protein